MRNKRRARHRKKKRAPQRPLPPERLLAQARRSLADGNPRKALELLRRVPRQDGAAGDLALWEFCACIARARQLAAKGLAKEAAVMRDRAGQHRAAIAVRNLPEPDLIRYLRYLDGGEAVQAYGEYLAGRPPLAAAERVVADRLVIDRSWDALERFAAVHPLRRDAGPVRRSLEAMDGGDWERAAGLLRSITRRSPFAPWRTFCKAMGSFAAGDDRGVERAAGLLPEEFPLTGTVAELRRCAGGGGQAGPAAVRQALGTDGEGVAATAAGLGEALRHGVEQQVERHLVDLADALHPDNPLPARTDLLMIAARATMETPLPVPAFIRVVERTVPEELFDVVMAQAHLLLQHADHPPDDTWGADTAAIYLDNLAVPFPRPADQDLARACVLESLARSGAEAGVHRYPLDDEETDHLTTLLGIPPQRPDLVPFDLLLASLDADPQSATGYRFLLDLLRRDPPDDEAAVRAILEALATRYPDRSDPWLELATLHYSRNAYRRAERALGKALRRAPHDDRILDLQAVGFLKSADQSRKRGRLSLAARDLARAADLRRPRLQPIVRVKRLLLDLVESGAGVEAAAARHLQPLAPADRLRTLAVAIHDLEENRHVKNVDPGMAAALRNLLAGAAGAIGRLEPDEALALVADLPADYRILYGNSRVAPVLTEWWGAVLARLDGDRLTACFDTLLACGGRKTVRGEVERRLRAGLDSDPLLSFYLAVIRYEEREDYGARRFLDILERVDAAGRRRLREAAQRLAPLMNQPLRRALQEFDFESLERMAPSFQHLREMIEDLGGIDILDRVLGGLGESPSAQRAGPEEMEERAAQAGSAPPVRDFQAALGTFARGRRLGRSEQGLLFEEEATLADLDRLEVMIGDAGLRGAGPEVMTEHACAARANAQIRRMFDDLAAWCTANAQREALSPELDALLYAIPDAGAAGEEKS